MKNFHRNNPLFSLCGLNCGLCSMQLDHYCPGCGGGAGNQPCAIARCSRQHESIEYCYLCDEYPCDKYNGINEFDSFITHRNQLIDFEKAKRIGVDSYQVELSEKIKLLKHLLDNYNDGRRKSFFCIAVNLLELSDIKSAIDQIDLNTKTDNLTLKEKATFIINQLQSIAEKQNIVLKLNKKPHKK